MRNRDSENYREWKKWNYFLNKDKICLRQNTQRKLRTEEQKQAEKEKQHEYYLARKAAGILERDKLNRKIQSDYRMEQKAEAQAENPPETKKQPKEKKPRQPRPSRYVKKVKEPSLFGTEHLQSYQKKKLLEKAPHGFYERPEAEDPFHLTWD
jgi:hypothetical protein